MGLEHLQSLVTVGLWNQSPWIPKDDAIVTVSKEHRLALRYKGCDACAPGTLGPNLSLWLRNHLMYRPKSNSS